MGVGVSRGPIRPPAELPTTKSSLKEVEMFWIWEPQGIVWNSGFPQYPLLPVKRRKREHHCCSDFTHTFEV